MYFINVVYFILGNSPKSLRGSKTGVFIGTCYSESDKIMYEKLEINGFGLTGCTRAMLANKISYWLGINGEGLNKYIFLIFNCVNIIILKII